MTLTVRQKDICEPSTYSGKMYLHDEERGCGEVVAAFAGYCELYMYLVK